MDEDSLERELSCGICFELYDVPLQLPCMHTFCKECLKDILKCSKTRKLKCPDCRRNVDLGKTGIESLKRNFKLASIVEIYKQASGKLSTDNEENKSEAAVRAPSPVEKDYEFLSSIIQSSQENANSPFEPHVIDDLWGTFRRTTNKASIESSRPPAPLPARPQPVGKSSTTPSLRPLPPIPRPLSRDVSHRPLPPSPLNTEGNEYTPFFSDVAGVQSSAPPGEAPTEPSAPPYFTLNQCHNNQSFDGDPLEDDWVDITSLVHPQSVLPQSQQPSIPPLPPRRMLSSPSTTDSNATRPPIPLPRTKAKGAPVLPKRNSGDQKQRGNTMDSVQHRPPPPLPRGRRS